MSVRSDRRAQVRHALLAAAEEQFGLRGYEPVSHADLAFAAGMARTTFYEYFASKEDLLVALVEERIPAVFERMISSIPQDLEPSKRLGELVTLLLEFLATEPVLGLMLHSELPRLGDDAKRRIAAAHRKVARELVAVIDEGLDAGGMRSPFPADTLATIVYEVVMTAGRHLREDGDPKQRVHTVAEATVDLLIRGLGA